MFDHVIRTISDHESGLGKPMSLGLTKVAWSVMVSEKEGVDDGTDILVYQARSSRITDLSSAGRTCLR
jgi:hypothetical protein